MLTDDDKTEIHSIVAEVVTAQLAAFAHALAPAFNAVEEMQNSLRLLIDGQALVEKTLAGAFNPGNDDEPWRESIGNTDG